MLIVNTTYHVAETHLDGWIAWVKAEYIPEVIQTRMLINPRFYRLLVESEPGTLSYALQFEVKDLETLESWFERYGKPMQQTMSNRFSEHVLGFTTLMESVE